MRMNVWPRSGQPKRIYLNSGGRWSVDAWLEPAGREPDWQLQIRLKDAEATARRIELHVDIESYVFGCLAEALLRSSGMRSLQTARWADWVALARQLY